MLGGEALELEIAILQYRCVCTARAKVHILNQCGAGTLRQTLNINAVSGYLFAITVKDAKGTANAYAKPLGS